jgi:general secretion pathway protein A
MYENFFQRFGLRENPFHISPDHRYYHSTPTHDAALSELVYSIETRRGFVVLTGEAGTGKTIVLNYLLDWLAQRGISSSYVFYSKLKPKELLEFIVRDFGIACTSARKGDLLAALHHWLIQRHMQDDCPVIIIDEAQALSSQTLDELILLLNLEKAGGKLVQLVLAGQPELEERLHRPQLRQLGQQVMFQCRLTLLTEEESSRYIAARLTAAGAADSRVFPEDTIRAIYALSRGIPRVINVLCEHSLLRAYADQQQTIYPEDVRRVATELDLVPKLGVAGGDPVSNTFSRLISFPKWKAPTVSLSMSTEPAHLPGAAVSALSVATAPGLGQLDKEEVEPLRAAPIRLTLVETLPLPPYAPVRPRVRQSSTPVLSLMKRFGVVLRLYWQDVWRSFVRDWRSFLAIHSRQKPRISSRLRTIIVIPITNWLRQPLTINRAQLSRTRRKAGRYAKSCSRTR